MIMSYSGIGGFISPVNRNYSPVKTILQFNFVTSVFFLILSGCHTRDEIQIPYESSLDSAAIHQTELKQLENSIIIGNGDINGLVYSVDGNINISLTKNDVWDGRIITKDDPPLFRVDLKNKKWSGGSHEYETPPSWKDHPYPCPIYCGIVSIGRKSIPLTALTAANFNKGENVVIDSKLQQIPVISTLDLKRGVAIIKKGARNPEVKVRVLAQRNIYLIETQDSVFLWPNAISFIPGPKTGTVDGIEYLHYSIPGDPDWKGMEYAVTRSSVKGKTFISIVTSLESKHCLDDAIALTKKTINENSRHLVREHETIWRTFWSKSGVELEDKFSEKGWYRNLYFMRCVSKQGVMPAALMASLEPMHNFNGVAWKGELALNYNAEQMYWAWYSCNHPELSEPYEKLIINYLPRAIWFARETFNCEGAFFPVCIFMHEPVDMGNMKSVNRRMFAFVPWTYSSALAGWVVQNLWLHYKYYPDMDLLRNELYRPLKEVALFYHDFLNQCEKGKNGKAIIGPSYSPEHGHFGIYQGTADITFMRMMFNIMIECNSILKNDQIFADKCAEALNILPAYPLSQTNPTLVTDYEKSTTEVFNCPVPVLPVYPVGEVNYFSSDETKTLFKNTIDSIRWNGNNGVITLAAARARLSMPNTLEWHKSNFSKRLRANGTFSLNQLYPKHTFNNWGHFTEQFAFSGVVTEMLVQGLNGIIRFFPSWPSDVDASFTNLRTEGGFLVSASMKQGEAKAIIIKSTSGGKLTFLNVFDTKPVVTINGKSIKVSEIRKDIYSAETNVNDNIEIRK
jgi:hypothetical protein